MEVKVLITLCLTFLLSGVSINMAQVDTLCEMARQLNNGPDVGCSEDLLKILKGLEPGSKSHEQMLEALLQSLTTTKGKNDEDNSHLEIVAAILNILMPNLQTVKDHTLNEQLAVLVKIADHLRSPEFPSFDFLTLLKVLESHTAYNVEMRIALLQKFIAYQATILSWEAKFMWEFRKLFPASLERKIIIAIIDMVKKDARPLDIAKHLVMFLKLSHQTKAMQLIRKYEKEAMEYSSGSCGMENEELHKMLKTIQEEIKDIKKRQSKSEVMKVMKWPGWKRVFTDEHEYHMFKDMAFFIESSYGENTFMWLQGMLDWMDKENWSKDLLKRILTMVSQNKNARASIIKSVMEDEKLSHFFYQVQFWMKTQNFSKSSSHIQMLHQIISSINFGKSKEEKKWIDGLFHWLDYNFDNSQEWAQIMKSIARSMVDKTWMYSLFDQVDEKIKVRVIIQHGKIMCNKSLNARKQSMEHILTYAKQSNELCRVNRLEFYYRPSVVGKKKQGKFVYRINDIQDNNYFKWIACIVVKGQIISADIDVMYKPKHMEEIHLMYMDPKALA